MKPNSTVAAHLKVMLRTSKPNLADLILHVISLDYHETLRAACGHQAQSAFDQAVKTNAGKFVLVVEGSIPTKDQGIYMKLAPIIAGQRLVRAVRRGPRQTP